MRYADAGVNISIADEAKRRIAAMAGKTLRRGVLTPIGGFGALFELDRKRWRDPILVASADGVGTKLKIAFATGIHSTVGADILNHCVNDILTQGAEPLFFLDYLAMGKMDTHIVEQVIEGMSRAAKQANCSLIGGETAEMPGFYAAGEYDLAGFIVGAVERSKQLDLRRVGPGDPRSRVDVEQSRSLSAASPKPPVIIPTPGATRGAQYICATRSRVHR